MEIKEIKREIGSVKNIRKLTGALETLSALKMKRAQGITLMSRPFAEKIAGLLCRMEFKLKERKSIFFRPAQSGKVLVLVMASDKGFSGSFNHNILRFSEKEIFQIKKTKEVEILPIGKKAVSYLKSKGYQIHQSFFGMGDFGEIEDIKKISDFAVEGFVKGKYKEVYLFYTHFVSTFSQKPKKLKLLPIDRKNLERFLEKESVGGGEEEKIDFLVEPSYDMLVLAVIPQFIEYLIYQAVLEANASEHSARMMAMRNASENAEEKVIELNLAYNKARQEQITGEVCEISSAKEVLD